MRAPASRGRRLLPTCIAAVGLVLTAAGTASAADPILPLAEVSPGMVGEARTVVNGTEIVTFPVTVMNVVRFADGPGGTLIIVRASGSLMDQTGGVADGMSGSPVYVTGADGVARVMGAVAYGSGDEANVIAGVTPIEQMIDSNSGLRANERGPARASAGPARAVALVRDRRTARALEVRRPDRIGVFPLTRWKVAGLSRPLVGPLARRLSRVGIRLASIAPRTPRPPVPLVPGASLSALLASGDVSVGAVGTVTYVDGATIIGFGHSLLGAGRSRFLMGDAHVYQTIPAPITNWSYKVAEPGTLQGMVVGDRADGITGVAGPVQAISGVATATDVGRGTQSTVRVSIAPDERTAPELSGVLQDEPVLRVTDGAAGGTLTLRISITSPDLARPFVYRNIYASTEYLSWAASGQLSGLVYYLLRNNLRPIPISAIEVTQRLEPRVRAATLVAAGVRGATRPGGRATLILRLQPWRASTVLVRVPVRLPAGVDASSPQLRIVPKEPYSFFLPGEDVYDEEGESAGPVAFGRNPLVRRATRLRPRTTSVRLQRVMADLETATDDRHDAVRLLAAGDDVDDPAAGVTVAVPYVVFGDGVTTRVTFR